LKIASASAKDHHVKISVTISESVDFRNFLALSRDSYPMGLGRLTAICLHVLVADRRHFSRFELDRAVQWPADRKLTFSEVLEAVGWAKARPNSRTLIELTLPQELIPRKPLKERARFRAVRMRTDEGKFASREQIEREVLMWKNREVVLIDMDGYAHFDLNSVSTPAKKSTIRKR